MLLFVNLYITLEHSMHTGVHTIFKTSVPVFMPQRTLKGISSKHLWKKSSSAQRSITQLSNTLEYGLLSLPRSKGKILMS